MRLMQLVNHVRDVFDRAGHLTPTFGLLLAASLHLLRDQSHVVCALHDELGAPRLLGSRRCNLLDRLRDATDRIGHLLRALGLLDRRARNASNHAPVVNSLIVASYVGSFMLTNQMRGRAIRSDKTDPKKAASIWHVVAVDFTTRSGDGDMQQLQRRFSHFVGLDEARGQP